jgi:hypothetical protein
MHGAHGDYVVIDMGGAQGQATDVDARVLVELPRAEVQPVGIGRQRPVRAVQHGKTLTSAGMGGLETPKRRVAVGRGRPDSWSGRPEAFEGPKALRKDKWIGVR